MMKQGWRSTEFYLTMWCVAGGGALALLGYIHDGVTATVGGVLAYAVSRGVAKAGYGKSVTRPPNTRF